MYVCASMWESDAFVNQVAFVESFSRLLRLRDSQAVVGFTRILELLREIKIFFLTSSFAEIGIRGNW